MKKIMIGKALKYFEDLFSLQKVSSQIDFHVI